MPGLDGRGPSGMGPRTGRRRGNCNISNDAVRYGSGLGLCRWIGSSSLNEKELLERRKGILEKELQAVKTKLKANENTGKNE